MDSLPIPKATISFDEYKRSKLCSHGLCWDLDDYYPPAGYIFTLHFLRSYPEVEKVRTLTVVFDQVPLFLSLALNESLVFCNHSIREISFLYLILLSVKYVLSFGEKAPGMCRVKSWWVPCVVTYRVSDKKKNWSSFEAQTPCPIRKRVTGQWLQEDKRLLPLPCTPGRSCRFSGLTFTHIFVVLLYVGWSLLYPRAPRKVEKAWSHSDRLT